MQAFSIQQRMTIALEEFSSPFFFFFFICFTLYLFFLPFFPSFLKKKTGNTEFLYIVGKIKENYIYMNIRRTNENSQAIFTVYE